MAKTSKVLKKSFWYSITHTKTLSEHEYKSMVRKVSLFVGAGFLGSFIVFLALAYLGGINKVIGIILGSNLLLYSLAFVSEMAGYTIRYAKWSYFLKRLKVKVPGKKNFLVYLSLYAMNITPGKIGRVVAAFTLNRITKIRVMNIVPIVTMDIFTDFLGIAILALIASIYFDKYVIFVIIADIVMLLPFIFLLNDWLFNLLKKMLKSSRYLQMFSLYGEEYFASQSKLNKLDVYAVSMVFTLPAAFFSSLTLFFALLAVGVIPPISVTVFSYTIAQITGMVSTVPGTVGVTDATLAALLNGVAGMNGAMASAVTIMSRMASLWFGVIIGGICLFYTLRYWNPKSKNAGKGNKSATKRR
jgi:uncharacterized protein (TIRG00374 family)